MSDPFNRILGLNQGDNKRIYQVDSAHLTQEEYEQGQTICSILWSEDGLVNSLGATWNMVHDPRFIEIENAYLIERPALFKGETTLGKQYIDDNSKFQMSSIAELEEYSTLLGEGRYFIGVVEADGIEAHTFKDKDDTIIWKYIRQECPNYFTQAGDANKEAQRLYRLFKADLLGLVADYALIPYCKEWIDLETSTLANPDMPEKPQVFAEVDFLERALTLRASLRTMAVKVLASKARELEQSIEDMVLTDWEADQLSKKIYSVHYSKLYTLSGELLKMLQTFNSKPLEVRKEEQKEFLRHESQDFIRKLRSGELEHLKPDMALEEAPQTEDEKLIKELMEDSVKSKAFLLLVELERIGDEKNAEPLREMLFNNTVSQEILTEYMSKTLAHRVASEVRNIIS